MTFNDFKKDIARLDFDETWKEIDKWEKALNFFTDKNSELCREINEYLNELRCSVIPF